MTEKTTIVIVPFSKPYPWQLGNSDGITSSAPFLIGEDPFNPEAIYKRIVGSQRSFHDRGFAGLALFGIVRLAGQLLSCDVNRN
jgi:hypothetical protein